MVTALEVGGDEVGDDVELSDGSDSESVALGKVPFNAIVSVPLTGPM